MPATPIYALPYPAAADPADVPLDMQELADRIELVIRELAYAEFTAAVNITATTEAGANPVVAAAAVSLDGATAIMVEFYAPVADTIAVAAANLRFVLRDNGTSIGFLAQISTPVATPTSMVIAARSQKITPSAGSHTYSIAAYNSGAGTGHVYAGAGGGAQFTPGYIRVRRW